MNMQHMTVYRNDHSYSGPISMLQNLPSGEILLVFREALWRGKAMHADPTARTSLIRSGDSGTSWHSVVTPDPSGGNGTTIAALSNGALVVTNFHWIHTDMSERESIRGTPGYREIPERDMAIALDGIYTCRSVMDGYTWDAPRKITSDAFFSMTTAGRIVELPDSGLLLPVNARCQSEEPVLFAVMRSDDQGANWEVLCRRAGELPGTDLHETRMVVLNEGKLIAMHRTRTGNFYLSASDDGGATWKQPVETPIWCGGSSPADLLLLGDGRLLCTYGHRREPYGIRACISEDGGNRWDADHEIVLRDDGIDSDMGYPSSIQIGEKEILTVYYWHDRDQIRHLQGTLWALEGT